MIPTPPPHGLGSELLFGEIYHNRNNSSRQKNPSVLQLTTFGDSGIFDVLKLVRLTNLPHWITAELS